MPPFVEARPTTWIGVPLPPVPLRVNQTSLFAGEKPVPVTVTTSPATATPVMRGFEGEAVP